MTTITNNKLANDVLEYVLAVVEDRYETGDYEWMN